MGFYQEWSEGRRIVFGILLTVCIVGVIGSGCARLPYTTRTIQEDERVVVTLQKEIERRAYSHPVQLSPAEWESLLRGFSIREQQRLPLRWFQEETPPKILFRDDEVRLLAPYLAEGMQHVKPDERTHFELRMPGFNPRYNWNVLAGWVGVQDPYLYLTIDYFHVQIPKSKSDVYDADHVSSPPPPPREYILYFEPGRFWSRDERGKRGVEFRRFLKSGEAGQRQRPQPPSVGAP